MGFFTKIAKLFATQAQPKNAYPSEQYKGFTITPQPIAANGQFRIAALIEKHDGDGPGAELQSVRQHHFIRSDTCPSEAQTVELTITKCKMFIEQTGEKMFD